MDNLRKEIEEEESKYSDEKDKDIVEKDIVDYGKQEEQEKQPEVKKELSKEFIELQEFKTKSC